MVYIAIIQCGSLCPITHPKGMIAGHFPSLAVHARVNMRGSLRKLEIYLHKYWKFSIFTIYEARKQSLQKFESPGEEADGYHQIATGKCLVLDQRALKVQVTPLPPGNLGSWLQTNKFSVV
jgi:DNA-directed RNA polymerase beta subunit